jgi:hypothetical protein
MTDQNETEKAENPAMLAHVGKLYYALWGYDQTNYDFLVIEKISPSGKTAMCRMASRERVGGSMAVDEYKPTAKPYGDSFRMKIINKGEYLRGSYPFIHTGLINDGLRLGTFFQAKENETYGQTADGWGH